MAIANDIIIRFGATVLLQSERGRARLGAINVHSPGETNNPCVLLERDKYSKE
jgi:hypothetical protein